MTATLRHLPLHTLSWVKAPALGSRQIDFLKYLALILMVIDHLSHLPQLSQQAVELLALIGRPVYPIFAFILVYHYVHHTRNKTGYLLRILFFAFIAEGPYQQMMGLRGAQTWYMANILFSLALGIATLLWIEWLSKFPDVAFFRKHKARNLLPAKWLAAMFGACAIFVASLFVDYLFFGVMMTVAYYLWLTNSGKETDNAAIFFTFVLNVLASWTQAFATLIFFPIMGLVSAIGEARLQWVPRPNRWFFYVVYPAHIILLILIGVYL